MPDTTEWLYWHCRQCQERDIRGDKEVCPKCGHQIDHEERMAMEGTVDDVSRSADVITNQKVIDRVAGPGHEDWWCNVCDKSVDFDRSVCDLCGAAKDATMEEIRRLRTVRGIREAREMHGEDRTLLVERLGPMEGREVLAGRGDETSGLQMVVEALVSQKKTKRTFVFAWCPTRFQIQVSAIAVASFGLVWLLMWGFSTHEVLGKVSSLNWERSEVVERYTQMTTSDWRSSITERLPVMPVNGAGEYAGEVITSCFQKWHHNDHVACGTYQEPYTVTVKDPDYCHNVSKTKSRRVADGQDCHKTSRNCTSNSNGTKSCTGGDEVCSTRYRNEDYQVTENQCDSRSHEESRTRTQTKYCPVPISYPYCNYTTYQWQQVRADRRAGQGHEMIWPGLEPSSLERMKREGTYTVNLAWLDDDKPGADQKAVSESEYSTWNLDTQIIVDVRNFGGAGGWRRK